MKKTPFLPSRYYQIENATNNDEYLFYEDKNYRHFLHLFRLHVSKIAELKAYCLLEDRFLVIIRIRDESEIPEKYKYKMHLPFSHMFNAYAKGMNSVYGRSGSLFREHFKRREILPEDLHAALAKIRLLPLLYPKSKSLSNITDFASAVKITSRE